TDAVKYKIADSASFIDQVRAFIRKQLHIGEKDKINFITLEDYMKSTGNKQSASVGDDRIAYLIAQGDIVDGKGSKDNIGSSKYVELLRKLREDDKVKAIVF